MPGMTMSMKIRSGAISRARRTPSAPSAAAAVLKPCFSSAFCITCTSVGESSTIRIRAMRSSPDMRLDRGEQLILGEGLGEIVLGADDAAARAVKQPVLGRQHDHRYGAEHLVVLDQRAGLIAVEPRHHDVDEHDVRLVVGDLRECIEAVDRGEHLAPLFGEQRLRGAPDGLAVVDDENLESLKLRVAAGHGQATPYLSGLTAPPGLPMPARCAAAL